MESAQEATSVVAPYENLIQAGDNPDITKVCYISNYALPNSSP